jgi:hypothetical protein
LRNAGVVFNQTLQPANASGLPEMRIRAQKLQVFDFDGGGFYEILCLENQRPVRF